VELYLYSLTSFHGGHRNKFTLLPICTRGREKKRGVEILLINIYVNIAITYFSPKLLIFMDVCPTGIYNF
jgi:hypothetical protein